MHDPEFIELRRKFTLGLVVSILFVVPLLIFFINKLNFSDSETLKSIKNQESIVIFYIDESCRKTTCKSIEKYLKKLNVDYEVINIDSDSDYSIILRKLDITEKEISVPTLMYIENGSLNSTLVDISTEEEISSFVSYNNLSNN
jgi:glutaredoxin